MDDYMKEARRAFSYNKAAPYLFALFLAKFLKSFGIYLFYDLLKHVNLVQLLFISYLVSSIVFVLLQRPFASSSSLPSTNKLSPSVSSQQQQASARGRLADADKSTPLLSHASSHSKRLSKQLLFKIFKLSCVQVFIKILWLFGLTQCGPLRATLLFEQSEFVALFALKAIFLSHTNPTRSRGIILLLSGTLVLLAFDYDDINKSLHKDPQDTSHHGIISHLFWSIISWFDVSDHKAGVLLLILALLAQVALSQSSSSKILITEIGGNKRLKTFTACMSTVILTPWVILSFFSKVILFKTFFF
jgi:solute carrier family 30 (zinc transporter), member 5/7